MMDVRVRKAKSADVDALLAIKLEGSTLLLTRMGHSLDQISAWQARFATREYLMQRARARAPHSLYVLEEEGEPRGMAGLSFRKEGKTFVAEFSNLYVVEPGRGFGSALMRHRLAIVDGLDLRYVESHVHERNALAQSFVERSGFTLTDTRRSSQHGAKLYVYRRVPETLLPKRGYCQCGCGGLTKISEYNKTSIGRVRGEPCMYVKGHASRMRRKASLVENEGRLHAELAVSGSLTPLVVDVDDVPLVVGRTWRALVAENTTYATDTALDLGARRTIYAHQLILPDAARVDHRDRDGLNNLRENLRECTNTENSYNRVAGKNSSSRFKGVSKSGDKWIAQIRLGGENRKLGSYFSEEDAARAYDEAAREGHGEFFVPNLPDD